MEQQSSEALYKLYQQTEGRPILVGLVSDVLNNHLKKLEQLITIPYPIFEAVTYTQIIKQKTDVRDERLGGRSECVSSPSIKSAIRAGDHFCGRGSRQSGQSCATNLWQ